MKLYYASGACSLAVHIALREVGAGFELVAVDLVKRTLADGTPFQAISPRGYVPVLEFDDGTRHTEGAALLQHAASCSSGCSSRIGPCGRPSPVAVLAGYESSCNPLRRAS